MSVTKSEIAKTLKDQGLGFVKLSNGSCSFDTDKCFTDFNGKRVKGISAGSVGPMTVTDAHNERTRAVMAEIKFALRDIGMVEQGDGTMLANWDTKKPIKLRLEVDRFPAYTRKADLDPDYKNIFIVPSYV